MIYDLVVGAGRNQSTESTLNQRHIGNIALHGIQGQLIEIMDYLWMDYC